jgi:hypothetical protein
LNHLELQQLKLFSQLLALTLVKVLMHLDLDFNHSV